MAFDAFEKLTFCRNDFLQGAFEVRLCGRGVWSEGRDSSRFDGRILKAVLAP